MPHDHQELKGEVYFLASQVVYKLLEYGFWKLILLSLPAMFTVLLQVSFTTE